MDEYFLKNYENYVKIVVEKAATLDGKSMEVRLYLQFRSVVPN